MCIRDRNRLLAVLDENSLRAAQIAKALEQFTLTVDFEQGREERIRSYEKAREEPVSYTHLDVYKRQMLMRTAISTKNLTMSLSTCLSAGTAALKRRRISTTTT